MKIKLTEEQKDSVIVESLKRDLIYILDPSQDWEEGQEHKDDLLVSLLRVLRYYTSPSEYETFLRKNGL